MQIKSHDHHISEYYEGVNENVKILQICHIPVQHLSQWNRERDSGMLQADMSIQQTVAAVNVHLQQ